MEVFGGEEVGEIRSRGVKRKWKEELVRGFSRTWGECEGGRMRRM